MNDEYRRSSLYKVIKFQDLLVDQNIERESAPHATILNSSQCGSDSSYVENSTNQSDMSRVQKSPSSSPERLPLSKDKEYWPINIQLLKVKQGLQSVESTVYPKDSEQPQKGQIQKHQLKPTSDQQSQSAKTQRAQ